MVDKKIKKSFRQATLVFLIIRSKVDKIIKIYLAMKKRGFGAGRWNGVGGKVYLEQETIEQAALRETEEEISVVLKDLRKIAKLTFTFSHQPD